MNVCFVLFDSFMFYDFMTGCRMNSLLSEIPNFNLQLHHLLFLDCFSLYFFFKPPFIRISF